MGDLTFVRDAGGEEEDVGRGEHEGGHVEPAGGEDVLLRLGAEAGHLGLGDVGARVGPGELGGEAHHRQHGLLLRGVDDRRHGRFFSLRFCARIRRRRRSRRGRGRRRWGLGDDRRRKP